MTLPPSSSAWRGSWPRVSSRYAPAANLRNDLPDSVAWSARPEVAHAACLAGRTRQRICRHDLDTGRDADDILDIGRQQDRLRLVRRRAATRLDLDRHLVHAAGAAYLDQEMRGEAGAFQDLLLDLTGEDVDATDDQHVVGPAGNLGHTAHRRLYTRQQPGEVAGTVTDARQRLLGQRGAHQLALRALGQHRTGLGVDDLGEEMVLPDGRAGFAGELLRHARTHHFGQAVNVARLDIASLLDLVAPALGPGLGAEDAVAQRRGARVAALAAELVEDGEHVARRDHDDLGPEVADQLDLLLGLAARHGDDGAAQRLGAVMRAEPAGNQAEAVGDMDLHPRPPAGRMDATRDQRRPDADILRGIADDGRHTGGARRRVDARHLLGRHRGRPGRGGRARGGRGGGGGARGGGERGQV